MMLDFTKRSIRNKYLVLLTLFGLLPIIILGVISNRVSKKVLEEELNKSIFQTFEKASTNIGSVIQRMSDLSDLLARSGEIVNSINQDKLNENSDTNRSVDGYLKNLSTSFNFPVHIFIVDNHQNIYSNIHFTANEADNILEKIKQPGYQISSKKDGSTHWLGIQRNILYGYDSDDIYYIAKNIIHDGEFCGVMYIGTGDYVLSRLLNNIKISEESKIFVFNEQNEIMFAIPETYDRNYLSAKKIETFLGDNFDQQYVRLHDSDNSVISFITEFNWKILMLTPIRSISGKLGYINNVAVIITLISIFFILVFLFLIDKSVVKPIIYLSGLMKCVRQGNFNIRSDLKQTNEIGILSDGFNKMVVDFKKMIEKIQVDERLKKDLEFKVLQSQIKPHFLYNTLNSIRWMAEMNNETKIGDSIISLVRMLEYNTKCNEKLVDVMEEVQYIKEYLYLQSLRYWNKFIASFDIDDEIYHYKMLKLSLQPIVENSIIHGLHKNRKKVHIEIRGRKSGDRLVFEIMDNGAGMDEETLASYRSRLQCSHYDSSSTGIGVANVNNRIRLEFGKEFGINVESLLGEGTKVTIEFPIIEYSEVLS